MIKILAIDMDGTLLNSDSKLDISTIEAIKKLNDNGVKSVLCSGRVATSLEYFNDLMGLDNPIIGNNGAIIKLNKEKILASYYLEDEDLKELIDTCKEHKCLFHFYDEDTFYSNRLNWWGLNHLVIDNDYGFNIQAKVNLSDDPYRELKSKNKKAYKILLGNLQDHPYGEEKITKIFADKFSENLYMTTSGPGSFEIMTKGVDKWQAVIELSRFLGINKEEIAAIGDSYNDLPMLKNSFISFAMGNAEADLKEICTYKVSDNNSGGIAEAVDIILNYNKENPSV